MDRKEIASVLASAGLRPQHQFGQNFMVDQNILRAIAASGDIHEHDVVLEVGPGIGNLTRLLAQAAHKGAVLAVDIDRKLMPAAQRYHETHSDMKNVTWLLADVLAGKHAIEPKVLETLRELRTQHPHGQLKLVSNLPYNAASPLVAELLVAMWLDTRNPKIETPLTFSRLAFTVQWEVGLRMNAKPDTRDYGPLGILIQSMATIETIRKIPPGAFWPPPKVNSALIAVTPDPARISALHDAPKFQTLLSGIFSHRRQTLANALKHHLADAWNPALKQTLTDQGFTLTNRPETFPIESLLRLHEVARTL